MSHEHGALAHHFDDLEQQHHAEELGMWLFLATEVLFFGGMFLAYSIYRRAGEVAFETASHELDLWLGTFNTCVLLTSSLAMAWAVTAAENGRFKTARHSLIVTMILGAAFIGIKMYEYHHKYETGLMPLLGLPFRYQGPDPQHAQLYFTFYFAMTGLHALHMVIGLGWMAILLWQVRTLVPPGNYPMRVHIAGLYWHFVDIVWVFLFPLFYLAGVR